MEDTKVEGEKAGDNDGGRSEWFDRRNPYLGDISGGFNEPLARQLPYRVTDGKEDEDLEGLGSSAVGLVILRNCEHNTCHPCVLCPFYLNGLLYLHHWFLHR